ncbi:hypothetical protein KKF61_07075 [Patescibacteria group bacterium]|nr:hypothetical protein [Patescibacteria group bacterium]
MKAIKNLRERRAISPVIATVILVAVAITVAVGVSYWMSGIAGQYTSFEKIEIQTGYAGKEELTPFVPAVYTAGVDGILGTADDVLVTAAVPATYGPGWDIILVLKNSGTTSSTLINCFINEKLVGQTGSPLELVTCTGLGGGMIGEGYVGITIESGQSETITIAGISTGFTSAGTTLNVKLHSAAGMDYIRLIQLP